MKKQPKLIALVDMDGTLCDHNGPFNRDLDELNKAFGGTLTQKTCPRFVKNLIRNQPGWWLALRPIQLGMDIYHMLEDMGFCVTVLTKGPKGSPNAWTEKFQWCNEHLNAESDITITQNKGLVYGKLLLDDFPPYIEQWLEWRPRGLVLMPHHDYNADFDHPQVMRVSDETDPQEIRNRLQEVVDRTNAQVIS